MRKNSGLKEFAKPFAMMSKILLAKTAWANMSNHHRGVEGVAAYPAGYAILFGLHMRSSYTRLMGKTDVQCYPAGKSKSLASRLVKFSSGLLLVEQIQSLHMQE